MITIIAWSNAGVFYEIKGWELDGVCHDGVPPFLVAGPNSPPGQPRDTAVDVADLERPIQAGRDVERRRLRGETA